MANLVTVGKAKLIAEVFNKIFGFTPKITYFETYAQFTFTVDQEKKIQSWIESQLAKKPGDIRFNLTRILMPIALKKATPFLLATAGIGYVLGKK